MNETEKYEEHIRRLDQVNAFKVPDSYFENFSSALKDKMDLLEGKTVADSNPFSTPEGYFANLSSAIADNVASKHSVPFFKRRLIVIPLACALLIGGFIFLNQNHKTVPIEYSYEDIVNSTYIQSIDEQMLIDELATTSTPETNDTLTQYIIDNNIDLSDLENAL